MISPNRFACSPGGRLLSGRRRLRRLFAAVSLLMGAACVWTFATGRWGPALLCMVMVSLTLWGRRLSGGAPVSLTVGDGMLTVKVGRHEESLELDGARVRPLEIAEIGHLESVADIGVAASRVESHLLGACRLLATNLENAVLVEVPGSEEEDDTAVHWIVTPDDPGGFVRAVEQTGG